MISVCNTYHVFFQQSQPDMVRLNTLPGPEPLWPVVVDKTSGLQKNNQGEPGGGCLRRVSTLLVDACFLI